MTEPWPTSRYGDECPITMVFEYLTPATLMGRQPNSQTTILDRYGGYATSATTI